MSCKDIKPECRPSHSRYISTFWGFTEFTPTIPKLYWNVKSQEQRILRICDMLDRLICYADYLGENTDELKKAVEELKSEFDEFKEHGFEDYYLEQIEQWVNDNLETLYHLLVKQVYFGLTLDGHFVAYIPESWADIVFDTGADYALDTYGRLILRWDVDGDYNVDQTPEVVRPWGDLSELEWYVRNIMNTLYSSEGGDNG
jgi:hypothetical protein